MFRCARRLPAQIIILAAVLFLGLTANAQTTNSQSSAEVRGRQLASEILSATPATNLTQTGILEIRNSKGFTKIPVTFTTEVGQGYWRVIYDATMPGNPGTVESLMIVHQNGEPNQYKFSSSASAAEIIRSQMQSLNQNQIMAPFAGSDFWIADLGLEFFHWPEQVIVGQETRRTRNCFVLESDNPNPANGYSRVLTWIDKQTLGIVHAEAYDPNEKRLKVFDPKSFKKVNGQWELQDIEIRNVQTDSRTRIRFNLNVGS